MKSRRVTLAIIGTLFALGIPALPLSKWENEFGSVSHLVGYEVLWWGIVAALVLYMRLVERRPLESIGCRVPRTADILLGAATGVVIVAGMAGIYLLVFPLLHVSENQQVNQLVHTPLWWRIVSVLRASTAEEILFRGYAIERLQELTGSPTIAAVVSWLVFTLEHVGSWGWSHVLLAGFGGILLTALYLWRRNLWANTLAHFIVDGAAVLLT